MRLPRHGRRPAAALSVLPGALLAAMLLGACGETPSSAPAPATPPAPAPPRSEGEELARIMRTGSELERQAALFFAQKKAMPEALDALVSVARHGPPAEAGMAIEGIAIIDSPASRAALMQVPLPALAPGRRRIAQLLAHQGEPGDALERRLMELLADPDPEVRQIATLGCKRLAKERAASVLEGLRVVLRGASIGGRLAALSVLPSLTGSDVVPDLRAALLAGPDAVSEAAAEALIALRAVSPLESAAGTPARAWEARVLARCSRARELPRDDPDPAVRLAARYGAASPAGPAGRVAQKLVVLVVVDTLRADALGAWGSGTPVSPHVDRLSRAARTWEVARSHAPWTLASHVALFTSRPASEQGVRDIADALDPSATTLAEVLRERGYATAGVASVPYLTAAYGMHQGFLWLETQVNQPASAVTRKAIPLLRAFRSLAGDADAPEGFFLLVHYFDPHETYVPPQRWRSLLDPGELGDFDPGKREGISEDDLHHLVAAYSGEVGFVDEEIARLLKVARKLGFARTDVYVTADHGEEFTDHGRFGHGWTLYEEQLRVPLLARLDGEAPSLETRPARLLDVPVMLLAREGGALPGARGVLPGAAGAPAFAESYFKGARLAAVVDGDTKVIRSPERDATYDLSGDPAERWPSDAGAAAARAMAMLDESGLHAVASPGAATAPVSPEVLESLKSLGYVE